MESAIPSHLFSKTSLLTQENLILCPFLLHLTCQISKTQKLKNITVRLAYKRVKTTHTYLDKLSYKITSLSLILKRTRQVLQRLLLDQMMMELAAVAQQHGQSSSSLFQSCLQWLASEYLPLLKSKTEKLSRTLRSTTNQETKTSRPQMLEISIERSAITFKIY